MISKTLISGQKPRGRQLNAKVCDCKSAIFGLICYDFCSNNDNSKTIQALTLILARNRCSSQRAASQPLSVFIASNSPWSIKAIYNSVAAVVKDAIFKFCTHAHTKSRSQAKYHAHWSGNNTSAQGNGTTRAAGTVSSRSSGQGL